MKHLIKTTILMLAILLPAIVHASQSFPVGFAKGMFAVVLPEAPIITCDATDVAVFIWAGEVESATVVLYECDDLNGTNPRVITNPSSYQRESADYTVYVYAVATNAAGETQSAVTPVLIPAHPLNPPDFTNGKPAEFMLDGIYYYRNGDNVTVTYGLLNILNNYSGNITIPETITYNGKTYSVTAIGASAFRECMGVASVNIPNSVTSIGHHAFYNCSGLNNLNIPNSVTSIGNYAFDGSAWYNNQPDGVVYVSLIAYKYKGIMPEGTSLNLNDGTRIVSSSAFSGCTGLTSVNIPNSVTHIGSNAFSGCTGLTSVNIPNSVTHIGSNAFSGCTGLTSISIGNSVTSIGESAFEGCTSLTSITIPSSVTNIGSRVFSYCTELSSIIVDSGNPIYDSRDNCNAIIRTSNDGWHGDVLIAACKNTVIPNTVESVLGMYHVYSPEGYPAGFQGYGAFYGVNMETLTIPVTVTYMDNGAFMGSYIKKIYFNAPNLECGVLPIPRQDWYEYPFSGCKSDVVVIGKDVRNIPDFAKGAHFSSVVIPNTVNEINRVGVFDYCEDLSSIYLVGEGGLSIGQLTYLSESYTIANLYIDAGLSSVNDLYISPTDVYCYATVPPQCSENTFTDYSGTLHVPAASIAAYFTAPYWCNFANIVGDDLEKPNSITLSEDSIEIKMGKTFNLTATVIPMNTLYDSFTMWQSSDNDIASVANGIVTGLSEGECDITVSCLGKKAICHVKIVCPISALSLDQTEVTIAEEESFTLTATILPESESNQIITWSSTNTEVAVVNKGLVTAIAEGECDITATCLGKKAVCHVIVTKPAITITLDQDTVMVLPNHIITLTPSATPVMPESFTASSSDPTVAAPRIMNGTVQVVGIKEGTATITVGAADGPTVPAICVVTVYTEPGDVNCDGFRNISDVTSLINYLLSGDDSSIKIENADLNVDGKVAIGDVTALINILLTTEAE